MSPFSIASTSHGTGVCLVWLWFPQPSDCPGVSALHEGVACLFVSATFDDRLLKCRFPLMILSIAAVCGSLSSDVPFLISDSTEFKSYFHSSFTFSISTPTYIVAPIRKVWDAPMIRF